LLDNTTKKMMEMVTQLPGVLAIKGCGAMGADSILVLVDSKTKIAFKEELNKRNLRFFDEAGLGGYLQ
ncbi:MAG: hypothetical protein ACK5P5_12065, partial [Pseudobdellovibrionaceae bacterium]